MSQARMSLLSRAVLGGLAYQENRMRSVRIYLTRKSLCGRLLPDDTERKADMAKADKLVFVTLHKRLCPSGAWDSGAYVKDGTVEIPRALMTEAVIVRFPKGVKGVNDPVARIDLRGQSYLVVSWGD
jgi:hypothetical protein